MRGDRKVMGEVRKGGEGKTRKEEERGVRDGGKCTHPVSD